MLQGMSKSVQIQTAMAIFCVLVYLDLAPYVRRTMNGWPKFIRPMLNGRCSSI
jgi:hypothetical protein